MDPIANGDFEETVPAAAGDDPIFGCYWSNGEGKVVSLAGGNHALRLDAPGEHAIQRFPAFEYIAQGKGKRYRGATAQMEVKGRVRLAPGAAAKLTVEETRRRLNSASWGLVQHWDGDDRTRLGDAWRYWTYHEAAYTYSPMYEYIDPQEPGPYHNSYRSTIPEKLSHQAVVKWDWQQVGVLKHLRVVRAWVAPESGRVLVQFRCAWNQKQMEHGYADSDTRLNVYRLDGEKNKEKVEAYLVDQPIARDGVIPFSRFIDVEAGNVIAFETREANPLAYVSPPILLDPMISYDARRVVYTFSTDPVSVPKSGGEAYHHEPLLIPPDSWTVFKLPVGQDYVSHFHPAHIDFPHGPVPQLSIRLEKASEGSGSVLFDDIRARVGFLKYEPAVLQEKLMDEMDRIIGNWLVHGFSSLDSPCEDILFDLRDGTPLATGGVLAVPTPFTLQVQRYSTAFWHSEATPWLLRAADTIVDNRFDAGMPPEPMYNGLRKPYSRSSKEFLDGIPDGLVYPLHEDLQFFIEMYDMTRDVTYLGMAARAGNFILDRGQWGPYLYHSTYRYEAIPDVLKGTTEEKDLYWSRAGMILARLAHRTAQFPDRALYRTGEYAAAAEKVAGYVLSQREGEGWGAWWVQIDTQLDDHFGYNAAYLSPAFRDTGNPLLLAVLAQGVEEFQPEWRQTTRRATMMAGDQQRAWGAWLDLYRTDPFSNRAYGEAYLEAALNYFRGAQLGNGVWCSANVAPFHVPDMGGTGAHQILAADEHKLLPLARAMGDDDLFLNGQGPSAGLREDLLACFSTLFELNTLHYGHYLETVPVEEGGIPPGNEQVGYMGSPDYGEFTLDLTDLKERRAGYEWRAISAFAEVLGLLEKHDGNRRPAVKIEPGDFGCKEPGPLPMTFTVTDADGIKDLTRLRIHQAVYDKGKAPETFAWSPLKSDLFTLDSLDHKTLRIQWSDPPNHEKGKQYRYRLVAVDQGRRWAMDSVLYEIE